MIDSAMKRRIDTLERQQNLPDEDLAELIEHLDDETAEYLYEAARRVRHGVYGHEVYLRGLIEFTNVCKNDCYYCGIRRSNQNAQRYRLSREEILDCCKKGYALGFRTFVLQGGEDPWYTDERVCELVAAIHKNHTVHWREEPGELSGVFRCGSGAVSSAAGNVQSGALWHAASAGAEH